MAGAPCTATTMGTVTGTATGTMGIPTITIATTAKVTAITTLVTIMRPTAESLCPRAQTTHRAGQRRDASCRVRRRMP